MNAGQFWIGIGFVLVGAFSLLSLRYGWRWWWGARPQPRTPGEAAWQMMSRRFSAWLCIAAGVYFLGDLAGIPPLFAALIGAAFGALLIFSVPVRRSTR
ncbi:MAG: hypothetical protein U0670_12150 [Anaerolineae bacterium]